MYTRKIITLLAITLFSTIFAASEINAQKQVPEGSSSFQSINFVSQHMSYDKNGKGIIETQSSPDAKKRSSFTIKKQFDGYTFEALYQPGWYLYVQDDKTVVLKQVANLANEQTRITFLAEKGVSKSKKSGEDSYTFKPAMFAGLYLRHCNFKLIVHSAKEDQNKRTMGCSSNDTIEDDDVTWKLTEPFTTVEISKADNQNYSFRSENYKDMYIHHNNGLGDITRTLSPSRKDATFKIVPGLTGAADTISFESVEKTGHYLRHESYRINLHPRADDELFKKDATFKIVPGKSGEGKSFEATNFPGYYIRHCGFKLYLDNNKLGNKFCNPTDDVYKQDVSYIILDGLAQ